MERQGTMTPERFGYSMPVDAPLYPKPPLHYKDATFLVVSYETDDEAAAGALPAGLTLPLPAIASVTVARYPTSSLGPYMEAIQQIQCAWEGQARSYVSKILLDSDAAIAAGREIYGFPKKQAFMELSKEGDALAGVVERPKGHRLVSVEMKLEQQLEVPGEPREGATVALRVIPSIEEDSPPSVMELTEVTMKSTVKEMWLGSGSLEFGQPSEADPWSALPVRKLLGAHHMIFDFELPAGRVLKKY